jgi:hypothetical protein
MRMADKAVFGQLDHVLAVLGLNANIPSIRHAFEAYIHRPCQVSQESASEPEHTQRFGPDAALHQAKFATVPKAFELEHQLAVGKRCFSQRGGRHRAI